MISDTSCWLDPDLGSDRPITFGDNQLWFENIITYITGGGSVPGTWAVHVQAATITTGINFGNYEIDVNSRDSNPKTVAREEPGVSESKSIDMLGAINLAAKHKEIVDLTGLGGSADNLTFLHLSNRQISRIGPVSGLARLTELWRRNNQITDIGAISDLTDLTDVELS